MNTVPVPASVSSNRPLTDKVSLEACTVCTHIHTYSTYNAADASGQSQKV